MTLIEPSWDAARFCAAELGKPGPTELIALEKCADRILAIDAKSLVDLPTYETSAMDGYVVSGNGPWQIMGDVKAGQPYRGELLEIGRAHV